MKQLTRLFTLVALAVSSLVFADGRKSLFVDKMNGFETYLETAVKTQELNVELIEEVEHPDLKVLLGNKFTSVAAEVLYRKNTGRTDDSTLQLIDIRTKKPIVTYDFKMPGDEAGKKKAAEEFIRQVKTKLK
jgi:hypothetical protein